MAGISVFLTRFLHTGAKTINSSSARHRTSSRYLQGGIHLLIHIELKDTVNAIISWKFKNPWTFYLRECSAKDTFHVLHIHYMADRGMVFDIAHPSILPDAGIFLRATKVHVLCSRVAPMCAGTLNLNGTRQSITTTTRRDLVWLSPFGLSIPPRRLG